MIKKNIIIYLSKKYKGELKTPFQEHTERLKKQLESLANFFPREKVEIYLAQTAQSHISGNIFIPQFVRQGQQWIPNSTEITADFVYGSYIPIEVTCKLNSEFKPLLIDKVKTETLFPAYTIKSMICNNYEEIEKKFSKITTNLKVLKPQFGTRGKGIFIQGTLPEKELFEDKFFPYILQEFFDTSEGFHEYKGLHDFRVIILNGKIIGKILRQPEDGGYISNTAQSGIMRDLSTYIISESIQKIIDEVDNYFSSISKERFYSIDLGIGKDGEIRIFEMNGSPGLSFPKVVHKLGSYIEKNILKIPSEEIK